MSKRLIKLALVTPFPSRAGIVTGGVEGVAVSLIRGLLKLGKYEIHVVSPGIGPEQWTWKDINVRAYWVQRSRLPGVLDYWTLLRRRIHSCLDQIDPDVTHFQGLGGWTIGYRRPFVFTIHGVLERDALFSSRRFARLRSVIHHRVECHARMAASDVIVISPYLIDELGNELPGRRHNIENPIDDEWFDSEPYGCQPRVLYVGRISERKNITGLLNAFSLVSGRIKDAQLILAGAAEDLAYERKCKSVVDDLGLATKVRFLGNVNREVVRAEMGAASCLVLVSHQETAPLILEEAMAAALPVVASNVCGNPHIVEQGKTGFLVNQADARNIAERIVWLLENPVAAKEMGSVARIRARERFSSFSVAAATDSVYEEVIRRAVRR